MSSPLELSGYQFEGHNELCLKAGAEHQNQVLLIPPLFDEMNRMRRMLVDVMRYLDDQDIGSILPDLPGSNESLFPQEQASLSVWKKTLSECLGQQASCNHIASFRGGCLIDNIGENSKHWRLTPAKGSSILRTMMRTRIASDKEAGLVTTMAELKDRARSSTINLAGNAIGPAMFTELEQANIEDAPNLRLARLASDSQDADVRLPGSALWLRAEPDADRELSLAIANDMAVWINA